MRAFLLLALATLVLPRSAHAQNALFFYEIGVDAAQGPLTVSLYNAQTGERYWQSTVTNAVSGGPDLGFDVEGPAGPVMSTTQNNGFITVTVPKVGLYVISFQATGLTPISFAWSDSNIPSGALDFYRPVAPSGTPDSYFTYANGMMEVSLVAGAGTTAELTDLLGQRGWTLPYDRATLCAAPGPNPTSTCSSGNEPTQFISAGVQTTTVSGQPTWRKLVPTFEFVGDVVPLASWGTVTWATPNLTLRFFTGSKLILNTPLNAAATTLTALSPGVGWGGVQFNAGSGGAWTGSTTVEYVAGDDPSGGKGGRAAISVVDASPTFDNVVVRLPVAGTVLIGLKVDGTAAAPAATDLTMTNMTGRGVLINGGARLDLFRGQITGSDDAAVAAAGTGTRAFLRRALTGNLRGPQIIGNEGGGVAATSSAEVRFGTDNASAPGYGYASVTGNGNSGAGGRGLSATTGADIYAGTGTDLSGFYQRNRIFDNATSSLLGNALASGTGSTVYARCAWWNTTTTSAFRAGGLSGGLTDASYYLTSDPYTTASPECTNLSVDEPVGRPGAGSQQFGRADGTAGRGTPEEETDGLDRLAAAMSAGTPAEAVSILAALVSDLPETVAAVAALGEAGEIAARPSAPASALALVTSATTNEHAALRVAAWQALVAVRRDAGNHVGALAAADALALEGGTAAVQAEVARVYLHAEAGDSTAARTSLAALETLAPGSVEAELARALVDPDAPPAAKRTNTAPTVAARSVAVPEPAGVALAVGPNPAGTSAALRLTLAEGSDVTVVVYDLLGRVVATPLQGALPAGEHRATLDVGALAPGVYVVRATANTRAGAVVQTARLTVAR